MVNILSTPMPYVLVTLIIYAIAYFIYGKWMDTKVWQVDPSRPTPAHVYMDGVEFFPVNRYVLYGFQFKSVAALGPIVGPLTAVALFGWVPALIWIILGNFFIGWLQDYSSMLLSVRNEGRSFGPITYELLGDTPRRLLLSYLLFYFFLISAAFIYVLASTVDGFPGSFTAALGTIIVGLLVGQLIYKLRMNIISVTILAIILTAASVALGVITKWPPSKFFDPIFGSGTSLFIWMLIIGVILFIAAVVPLPTFITPVNYIAFYPTAFTVIAVLIAALVSPLIGVSLQQPQINYANAFITVPNPQKSAVGPIWPILFVTIACGAISGWHSLVSSGISSRQLDVETDARPVGGGAMILEGMVALSALITGAILTTIPSGAGGYVTGGSILLSGIFGASTKDVWNVVLGVFILLMGITVQTLITRYWRIVSAEIFSKGSLRILGNKYVATMVGLILPIILAAIGSWPSVWIFFGGTNQLLAGFALTIVAVYLMKVRRPTLPILIPGLFMLITTIAALAWESAVVLASAATLFSPKKILLSGQNVPDALGGATTGVVINLIAGIIGVVLVILGIIMAYYLIKSYFKYRSTAPEVTKTE
ncbi:MAG: carbon starvation CstA family protein [Thermoprotei archaeon]|jgi:carbon starvation protein